MKQIFIVTASVLYSFIMANEAQSIFTGNANFYYISKLDNGEIIRMPYRMLNTTWASQHSDFELVMDLAIEYQPQNNYSFKKDNPQDFLLDLRELYMAWVLDFGEIRIGKHIQSWGFVEQNSPLDNSGSYDYNFLFEAGTDRKVAATSLSTDIYYKNFTFGFTATPFHSINRLPASNAEFPIELPVMPQDYQFMDIEDTNEYGAYLQMTTDYIDIGLSYFSGYDRIFHLAGVNIPQTVEGSIYVIPTGEFNPETFAPYGDVVQDTVFSYRKTDVLGFGAAALISDLTIKADVGLFKTAGVHENIERPYHNPPSFPVLDEDPNMSIPSKETAEYYQVTAQLEYKMPFNTDLLLQYFKYDTLSYKSETPLPEGEFIEIPAYHNLRIEGFNPYDYFYPGMGSPLALITKNAVLGGVKKKFLNDRLTVVVRDLIDLDYSGHFLELNTDYRLSNNVVSSFAINYIKGDENHPKSQKNMGDEYVKALDYPLNQMEGFSHFRMQVRYSF